MEPIDANRLRDLAEAANEIGRWNVLEEGSLSRIYRHTIDRNIGMLTAFRGRYSRADNRRRNAQLESDIRSAGFGFFRIDGRYVEGFGGENPRDVREEVFLVIGDGGDDNGRLKGFMRKWGAKYNQDSVFFKPFEGKAVLIGTQSKDEDGNAVEFPGMGVEFPVGECKPMKMGQFYSRMKGRPFVFEQYEVADSLMSAWARKVGGTVRT